MRAAAARAEGADLDRARGVAFSGWCKHGSVEAGEEKERVCVEWRVVRCNGVFAAPAVVNLMAAVPFPADPRSASAALKGGRRSIAPTLAPMASALATCGWCYPCNR